MTPNQKPIPGKEMGKKQCSGCQAQAIYQVAENYSCRRHLQTFVAMHTQYKGQVTVDILEANP